MKFIILVFNLKETSLNVFSWKKNIWKNYDAILLLKYDSAGEKKKLNYAYVLKNGVDQYNIFFLFLHKACWILLFVSFSYSIRQCFVQFHDLICAMCCLRQQTILHMRKRFPEWIHCQVVWILRRSTLNSLRDVGKSNSDVIPSF